MIQLPQRSLPKRAKTQLDKWQQDLNILPNYSKKVSQAKSLFSSRNTKSNATFGAVRSTLADMCSGARRCCYCEDSVADEVEHIKPKDLYPEEAFVWENYLFACGPCNGPKNNRFAIFLPSAEDLVDVTRKSKDPILPPPAGDPVLINPRFDDPSQFMELDLLGTFFFLPLRSLDNKQKKRADYTIKLLGLNDRDYLVQARGEAFGNYRARLVEYIQRKEENSPNLVPLIAAIKRSGHPTVWKEMQRQSQRIPKLSDLFSSAPEALSW